MTAELRRRLVASIEERVALSEPVRDAFLAVPRDRFLLQHVREHGIESAYRDDAIVTKTDASGAATSSSSQPTMMALMLEALRLERGQRVLEIGAGTGYNAALLARIVGPEGRVVSVDVDPDTAAQAGEALLAVGARVEVVAGDGRDGWPAGAPYDRIVVTASVPQVARAWWSQLADGGLFQAPLQLGDGLQPVVTFRREERRLVSSEVVCGSFMALRSPEGVALGRPAAAVAAGGIRIAGGALRRLDGEARARLLRLVSGEPRAVGLGVAPFFALGLYLSLTIPRRRYLGIWPPYGIGVATPEGAAFVVAIETTRPVLAEVRAYGDSAAESGLLARIRAWEARGRPGEADLQLAVDFTDESRPRLTRSWNGV